MPGPWQADLELIAQDRRCRPKNGGFAATASGIDIFFLVEPGD
jgi:hypothetical protein